MNKHQYILRSSWILVLNCLLLSAVSATAQTKQEVIDAWKQQIESIKSLQLGYESSLEMKDDGDFTIVWKQKFALSGEKYFSYLTLANGNVNPDFTEMGSAFNGINYQGLMKEKGEYRISISKSPTESPYPYQGPHPFIKQYEFLLFEGEPHSIETLQKAETWERLADRIISIKPTSRDKLQGYVINVKSSRPNETYRVFVDEKTYWPRYWSSNIQHPVDVERTEISDMNVQKTISIIGKKPISLFPSEIVFRELRDGEVFAESKIITDETTLHINDPVPDEIFTLSKPNATYVDAEHKILDD